LSDFGRDLGADLGNQRPQHLARDRAHRLGLMILSLRGAFAFLAARLRALAAFLTACLRAFTFLVDDIVALQK